MEVSFIYEAKEQSLIIHLPKELDHHNCRNFGAETIYCWRKITSTGLFLIFLRQNLSVLRNRGTVKPV